MKIMYKDHILSTTKSSFKNCINELEQNSNFEELFINGELKWNIAIFWRGAMYTVEQLGDKKLDKKEELLIILQLAGG